MGEVYKVRHVTLGAISALKVLPSHLMENADLVARFYREARVMAKLIHPNIVRVIDIDHDKELNYHYFVMEYIQGRTLREYLLEKQTLPLEVILRITRQVAQALQLAHNNDPPVIHRDIKPANIMLEFKTDRAVLMDFGIAKELDDADMTRSGMMLGTVRYCPREQMLYEALDGRADIYALGMVMYEAYTGKHFFSGLNENQVISRVLGDKENEPELGAETPAEFTKLITKSIANKRENRYRDLTEFLSDLETCWSLHIDKKLFKDFQNDDPDLITDLDEHIQKLEQEKRRRLVFLNLTKCKEAKEKAIQEEAAHLIEDLYLEGCKQEVNANDYLNQSDYTLAQKAFETATNLFSSACQKAFEIRLQEQTEQIKQQVQVIKAEADNYNAREKARTFYGRALDFQSKAEELMENASFDEAFQSFKEAYRIFEDARELAYHKLQKEEVDVIQARSKEAFSEAVKAEAEALAPAFFKKGLISQQKAEAALSTEDFLKAKELFNIAIENYTLAQQQGITQRNQQAMVAAKNQAEQLWRKAEEVGAAKFFNSEFAKAKQLMKQAQQWETQQKLEQAAVGYGKAANAFDYVRQETEFLAAREQAELIKQQLANTKAKLYTLRSWAKDAWTEADTIIEEADTIWDRQQYPQALMLYKQALEKHAQAEQKSIAEKFNEQALLIQTQLQESQRAADYCRSEQFCQDTYLKAIEAKAQGEDNLTNRQYQDGLKSFQKAEEYFEQALAQRHQQLKEGIKLAQHQAIEAQAQKYAITLYDKGQDLVGTASALWNQSSFDASYDNYCEAQRVFEEARRLSEHSLQKEKVEAIQVQVRDESYQAIAIEAQELSPTLFQQAVQSEKQGDAAFTADNFVSAKDLYESAIKQYTLARQQGLELRKKQIKIAQQQASESQNMAIQAGAKVERDTYRQAFDSYRSGQKYVDQKEYKKALQAFEIARTGFQQAQQDDENERKQKMMLAAKEKAEAEYNNAEQVGTVQFFNREFKDALQLLEQARHNENQGNFEKAADLYEKIAKKCKQLSSEALLKIARQNLELSRDKALTIEKQVKPIRSFAEKTWNEAQNLKTQADKVAKAKDYNKAAGLYDDACERYKRAKFEAENQRDKLKQEKEKEKEKKLIANTDKQKRGTLLEIPFINRKSAGAFFVLLVILAGYTVFKNREKSLPFDEFKISKVIPQSNELTLADNQIQVFSIEVHNKDNSQLDYKWLLDGHEIAKSDQWEYKPEFEREAAPKEVKVIVTDKDGHRLENSWRIMIEPPIEKRIEKVNNPPNIVETQPSITDIKQSTAGQSIDFSVKAVDEDSGDHLAYAWFLDGKKVSTDTTWEFVTPASGGQFNVEVRIMDSGGQQVQRLWHITATPPPENHPPHIAKAEPAKEAITLNSGGSINFSANATDPDSSDRLVYEWALNGRKQSSNKTWRYKTKGEGTDTVTLTVSDQGNLQDQRTWRITTNPLPENHPPSITKSEPANESISLNPGDSINFSANATDPDSSDRLTYEWTLNGRKQSGNKTWRYKAKAEGTDKVTLTVSDQGSLRDQRIWRIMTNPPENHPPRITGAKPAKETVTLALGESINFSANTTDPDSSDSLTYEWALNGRKQSSNKTWLYTAKTEGTHAVTLTVSDRGNLQDQRIWRIITNPPTVIRSIPENALTEAEVKKWLETVRRSWENKNISKLVEAGGIDSQNASELQTILSQYENFHVEFKNIEIEIKGNQATAYFTRVDTIDGKTLTHPDRKMIKLEKRPDGRLVGK